MENARNDVLNDASEYANDVSEYANDVSDYTNDQDWDQIDKHIAKIMNSHKPFLSPCKFKRITDSFKNKGVQPLQHIIYVSVFKNFTFHQIPIHLHDDFMKYIIRKVKNYMFDGFLPHQNKEFTQYLFDTYGSTHPFVELFAFGFKHWTYEKISNVKHFISWISWILHVRALKENLANLLVCGLTYNLFRIASGLSGLRYEN